MVAAAMAIDVQVPEHLVLGQLPMFEIRDRISIPQASLKVLWEGEGLNPKHLPKKRAPEDAFRKACRAATGLSKSLMVQPYDGPAMIEGSLIESVLVQKDDDETAVRLHHRDLAILLLDQHGVFKVLTNEDLGQDIWAFLHAVEKEFGRYQSHIDRTQMRGLIARVLRDAHATKFRGGAYLVPRQNLPLAQAISNLIRSLDAYVTTGDRNSILPIWYVDGPFQRKQLKDELAEHIQREASQIIGEAQAQIAKGTPIKTQDQTWRSRLIEIGFMIQTYEQTLAERLTSLHTLPDLQKGALERTLAGR